MEKIVSINKKNIYLIDEFIQNAGDSLKSFRYFEKRPIESINSHIHTCILMLNDSSIGYGHLDFEKDVVWLGIALSPNNKGKGYGKKIMSHLINIAKNNKIKNIQLSVDIVNHRAVSLYKSLDFRLLKINKFNFIMKKTLLN